MSNVSASILTLWKIYNKARQNRNFAKRERVTLHP